MKCPVCSEVLEPTPFSKSCKRMYVTMVTGGLHTSERELENINQYICKNQHIIYLSSNIKMNDLYIDAIELIKSI